MAKRNDSSDPDRNVAVNSATDPQRPGSPSHTPAAKDSYPPGTTAAETTVPTDTATATHEPGPALRAPAQARAGDPKDPDLMRGPAQGRAGVRRTPRFNEDPADRGDDPGRSGVE